ncbi:Nucleolar MIF4G domain-containing protein 1 [Vitis vinifera]|uniref:Nucleolar MIF4G domain-containing protein 1 n=1 Tax=Vitis vinifera TaxID=29760 RepID=A0A438DHB3_VITVI|nr:Nucleolar MIF4G domain-containing protein 1 [Vitis vinifera]
MLKRLPPKLTRRFWKHRKCCQLAASQRMNTDARRAIFCIIMSGEDYLDAFEKLLRLALAGRQDREIMRVLLECCLREKAFNKYYTVLASKLCEHDKNQKFTLQVLHLTIILPLGPFQRTGFNGAAQINAPSKIHCRDAYILHTLTAIFEKPDKLVWNVFTRIAVAPELETLRNGILFFIREYVASTNQAAAKKFRVAKKALNNLEGVLM